MDIPSQTPDSSGHWLLGKKKSDVSVNSILGSVSMVDSEVGSLDDKQQLKEQIESQTGKEESICDKQATAFPHLTLEEAVGELPSRKLLKSQIHLNESQKLKNSSRVTAIHTSLGKLIPCLLEALGNTMPVMWAPVGVQHLLPALFEKIIQISLITTR